MDQKGRKETKGRNYHLQVILEECKYGVKEKKDA